MSADQCLWCDRPFSEGEERRYAMVDFDAIPTYEEICVACDDGPEPEEDA